MTAIVLRLALRACPISSSISILSSSSSFFFPFPFCLLPSSRPRRICRPLVDGLAVSVLVLLKGLVPWVWVRSQTGALSCAKTASLSSARDSLSPRATEEEEKEEKKTVAGPSRTVLGLEPEAGRRRNSSHRQIAAFRLSSSPPPPSASTSTHSRSHRSWASSTFSPASRSHILRPPAARLANPVDYVPRITPVPLSHTSQASDEHLPLEARRDSSPLLSLSERRRSRLSHTPSSLVVERSHVESVSGRTSVALPPGRRSGTFERQLQQEGQSAAMNRLSNSIKGMEESNTNPSQQAHLADPTHPPRHVQSQVSLLSQSQIASIPSSTAHGLPGVEADVSEELAWGPAHPCFPHVNPHVPINSKEYLTTRIIRVKRDWMVKGDLAPTFSNLYPEILDPLLPEQEFRKIIATVNNELIQAFNPFSIRNCIDAVLGLLTGWLWEDIGASGVKYRLKNIEAWLENWNREVGVKTGVRVWSLRRTAYLSLDIQIPDPKVGVVQSEDPSLTGTRPNTAADGT